ncbi:MAG: manganese efflux pump [Nitrospirae bacterium]|nr:manganese efflux pump [Nitrospirota bacterium]
MHMITIIFIAFGLAMDAFAVSITSGLTIKQLRVNNALKIAIFFGLFQAIMPIVGWLAGLSLRDFISGIDHWVAFGLLSFIGCKMIYESIKTNPAENKINPLNIYVLLILSFTTSIDALAVGVSFAFLKVSIITPIIAIGAITFLLSFFGVFIGNKFGHFFEKKIEIAGGLVLIAIGIKMVVEAYLT